MIVAEQRALDEIREKVEANERLSLEDGLTLMESDDLLQLGELADTARRVRGGTDEVYFVQNLYVNQTNVCRVKCKFCAFAATSSSVVSVYACSCLRVAANAQNLHFTRHTFVWLT